MKQGTAGEPGGAGLPIDQIRSGAPEEFVSSQPSKRDLALQLLFQGW